MITKKIVSTFSLKLKYKFLLSYFLLIIVPLMLLSGIISNRVSNILERNINFSTSQAIDQTYSFLSYKLYRIGNISDIIRVDKNITDILSKNAAHYNVYDQVKDMYYLRNFLSSFEDNNDIFRIRLYVNDEYIYSTEGLNLYGINQAEKAEWYSVLKEYNSKNLWIPSSYLEYVETPSLKLLSVASTVKNPDDYSKATGFLRVDFKKQMIEDIIKKANSVNGSFTYIQNMKEDVIVSSDDKLIEKYKIKNDLAADLSKSGTSLHTVYINNEKCLISSSIISNTDWYIITIVPYSKILSGINSIRLALILLMFLIGTIAYFFAYKFSLSITNRISMLNKGMKKVYEGDLTMYIENSTKDEIGELIKDYNFMLARMALLIEEQYKSGKEVKNAELKALQAQINPHFLYNTLDMINWMALKNMNAEISKAVRSLAKFYKLSLNKGKDIVTLEDEIAHIFSYVQIQNMRYSNRINLIINVSDDITNLSIIKITLQPIVENSILHGILGKGAEIGSITISAKVENEVLFIYVADDGIGISEELLDKILTKDISNKKGSGYGLKNIDQRIKLYYGENYGLTFRSEIGKGTEVEVKIPAKEF